MLHPTLVALMRELRDPLQQVQSYLQWTAENGASKAQRDLIDVDTG